jgi:serine protease Do
VLVSRNGNQREFVVTLDALSADEDGNLQASTAESGQSNALGIVVESVTGEQQRSLGNPEGGVLITEVESDAAYRAGLRRGDLLLMINSSNVDDVGKFNSIVKDLPEGKAVALRIQREGATNFIAYTPSSAE